MGASAVLSSWEALLNTDKDDAERGNIVKAELNAQGTMYTKILTQGAALEKARTEVQERTTAETKVSVSEMSSNDKTLIIGWGLRLRNPI